MAVVLGTQPVVKLTDAYGNAVTNGTTVTVTGTGGNVQGTTSVATAGGGGVAAFTNLSLTNAGSVTLTFTSGSATVNSSPVAVSAGSVTQLVWATQPGNATNALAFGTQPVLRTADQYGNFTTNGLTLTNALTVTQTAGSGALSGATSYNIGIGAGGSNGVVACSGLAISLAGSGDQLTAVLSLSGAPTNIANCSVWLDAGDTNTVTLSGANVTAWNDKSGNGVNFVPGGMGSQGTMTYAATVNGKKVVTTPACAAAAANAAWFQNTAYRYTGTTLTAFAVFVSIVEHPLIRGRQPLWPLIRRNPGL